MAKHEFGIMDRTPVSKERYDCYEPEKYKTIFVEDELLEPLHKRLNDIDFFWHSLDVPGKGLAYCGITLIPPESMDAAVKIFLTARDEVRAHRRYLELVQKGTDTSEEEVLQEMLRRDRQDRTRAAAPAVPAPDAVLLDNSEMNREETLEALLEIVGKTLAQKQIALPEVRGE